MENFKSFFKKGEDSEKLKEIIDQAVQNESQKLQHGASQDFKENREDQEYNIVAYKHFVENILGKKVENFDFKEEEVKKIEKYIENKNQHLLDRIDAIYEYIQENSGALDMEAYQEKIEKLSQIEGKIREINHQMVNELSHAEHFNNQTAFYYGESLASYEQQLNQLEIEKEILEHEIDSGAPKIDSEEEDELIKESNQLSDESQKLQNYLYPNSDLN